MPEKTKFKTSIGGSALIEGIMMRGPKRTSVAVRMADKSIYTEDIEFKSIAGGAKFFKLPLVRGFVNLVDSMRLSMKCLMLSAEKSVEGTDEEEEEPSKFEKWLEDKLGDKLFGVVMTLASILGIVLAILLFFALPTFIFNCIAKVDPNIDNTVLRSAFEGVLKILLFLGYIIVISRTPDMKRVFMYHGAEHKTIFCYENEEELTVENVRKFKRFHPRCGTSFMIIMLLVGVIIGLFIPATNPLLRTLIKLLLLPVSCGVGYELIKICAKYDNPLTRVIAAPGLAAQRITTIEPDDDMIEIAIAAIKKVIPENGEDRI